jgi:AAA15 family ATPase/GTPase
MLIAFKVENFRSFGKQVEFSCVATAERAWRERVFTGPKGLRLLSVAAIYGANASGKSILYRAVEFARNLVVTGVKPEAAIPVQPFRLNERLRESPARFEFEVLIGEQILNYQFAVTSEAVVEESLAEVHGEKRTALFSRTKLDKIAREWDLHYLEARAASKEEKQFISFVAKGTPANQLFLREAQTRNLKQFEKLWKWFQHSLILIDPQSTSAGLGFEFAESQLNDFSTRILRSVDVGIARLATEAVALDSLSLPKDLRGIIENDCKEGQNVLLHGMEAGRISFSRVKGELQATKLVSYHQAGGTSAQVPFDFRDESDGTQRVLDLLPAFYRLANEKSDFVVFVDELDRSLHSRLTRALIEGYLDGRPSNARTQFLFTTHDATLLKDKLFRNDEVWLVEKGETGESEISSLGDFKLRSDKRLVWDYLSGRFGGVPNMNRVILRHEGEESANQPDPAAVP